MYLSADDDKDVYGFTLEESTSPPELTKIGEVEDDVTGVAVYVSETSHSDYLFVASKDVIAVYGGDFDLLGTMSLSGMEDIEVQGLNLYQAAMSKYPSGAVTFAIESEEVTGFGAASLDGALQKLGVAPNTGYDPRHRTGCRQKSPICDDCSLAGYCLDVGKQASCECFYGFDGPECQLYTCTDDCSGQGTCVGPNICKCDDGWGGLQCSFLLVEPLFETDANGGDGDDPAIWISPVSRELSRIVTTTKSEEGAGLSVFDLTGNLLQRFEAGEPNNVDIIYGFQAGNRSIDLAFAACRTDDTLW